MMKKEKKKVIMIQKIQMINKYNNTKYKIMF
jgi:hypothetical protein